MKNLRKKIENWLNAVTFAEAGEHETALQFVGKKPARRRQTSLDDLMTAITFAEAGFPDTAKEFLGVKSQAQQPLGLDLPGVKIWYGMATIRVS